MNDATKECLEFLNSLQESQLIREYNISSLTHGYRVGGIDTSHIEDTQQEDFKEEVMKKIKGLQLSHEKKAEDISKQHQSEVVSYSHFIN